jgi:hypothetical protein
MDPFVGEQLLERVGAVEDLAVKKGESEELLPKLATLREVIGDLTLNYENRLQEVQARNAQAMQDLKHLANRVSRRDERLSTEVAKPERTAVQEQEEKAKAVPKKTQSKDKGSPQKAKDSKKVKDRRLKEGSKENRKQTSKMFKQARQVYPSMLNACPMLPQPGWLAQAVPHVQPNPLVMVNGLANIMPFEVEQAPMSPHPQPQPSPFVPGEPTPSPSWDTHGGLSGGLMRRPVTVSLDTHIE